MCVCVCQVWRWPMWTPACRCTRRRQRWSVTESICSTWSRLAPSRSPQTPGSKEVELWDSRRSAEPLLQVYSSKGSSLSREWTASQPDPDQIQRTLSEPDWKQTKNRRMRTWRVQGLCLYVCVFIFYLGFWLLNYTSVLKDVCRHTFDPNTHLCFNLWRLTLSKLISFPCFESNICSYFCSQDYIVDFLSLYIYKY